MAFTEAMEHGNLFALASYRGSASESLKFLDSHDAAACKGALGELTCIPQEEAYAHLRNTAQEAREMIPSTQRFDVADVSTIGFAPGGKGGAISIT